LEKSWKSLGNKMEALERKTVGGWRLEIGELEGSFGIWGQKSDE
jgi:hypothetical protein